LSLDAARDVLSSGASAVPGSHIDPTDPILKNLVDLQTAMIGLQAQVASLTEQVFASQAFQCAAVKGLQSDRFAIFPMAPTATARQTCASERPAPVNLCP